ncbi:MAG: DUF6855 family protein [Agrococcus sp.]
MATGSGTKDDPWVLQTAPGTSEYSMHRDDETDPPQLVCIVGSTKLTHDARAVEEPHAMLKEHGDRMPVRQGYRGRFVVYLPPLLEALGLVELTHDPRNNRVRAI